MTTIFSVDERDFVNGTAQEPIVLIKELTRPDIAEVSISMNTSGFEKYRHMITEYESISLDLPLKKIFDLTQDEIGRVCELIIFDDEKISFVNINLEYFYKFKNVRHFSLQQATIGFVFDNYFPNLEALSIEDYKSTKLKYREDLFPCLRKVGIENFSGSLKPLSGWKLETLFLQNPKIKSLDEIPEYFPNLKTLVVRETRKAFELKPLSNLEFLENLCIESTKEQVWDNFHSKSIKLLMINKLDKMDRLKQLNNLEGYSIDKLIERGGEYVGDWDIDKTGNPFDTILGPHFIASGAN